MIRTAVTNCISEKIFKILKQIFFYMPMLLVCALMSFTYSKLVLEFESVDQPTLLISSSYSFSKIGLGSMIKHVLMKNVKAHAPNI